MKQILRNNTPVIIGGLIYTVVAMITVFSAWMMGIHETDLELTISRYVALRPWTAILYGICMSIMVLLILIYIRRLDIPIIRKVLYTLIFTCILGCAFFPSNREWSTLVADLHNIFAYTLMVLATINFIVIIVLAKTKEQRVMAIVATIYAAFFILCYVIIAWEAFVSSVFIWENTFIYLLIIQLMLEYPESRALSIICKMPSLSLLAFGACWVAYFLAPRNSNDITGLNSTYWDYIGVVILLMLVIYPIFLLSFIASLIYKPLWEKRRAVDIILRILAAIIIIPFSSLGVYLSIFIISGAGY